MAILSENAAGYLASPSAWHKSRIAPVNIVNIHRSYFSKINPHSKVSYYIHMPRRNKPIPRQSYQAASSHDTKVRYKTKQEAQQSADYRMVLQPDLQLRIYKCS